MKTFGLVFFAVATLASAASAETPISATLSQPLAANQEYIINATAFDCSGASCVSVSKPVNASGLLACRALKRQVGVTLTAYGALDADKLAACNAD